MAISFTFDVRDEDLARCMPNLVFQNSGKAEAQFSFVIRFLPSLIADLSSLFKVSHQSQASLTWGQAPKPPQLALLDVYEYGVVLNDSVPARTLRTFDNGCRQDLVFHSHYALSVGRR